MEKFIKFMKKPMLIISSIALFVSIVALIVVSCLKHGKTYKSDDLEDVGTYMTITFEDRDTLKISKEVWGQIIENEYQYKIEDRKLYIAYVGANNFEYAGKISSYEMVYKYNDAMTYQLEFECGVNEVIADLLIVLLSVSLLLMLLAIALLIFDKDGKLYSYLRNNKKAETESTAVKADE